MPTEVNFGFLNTTWLDSGPKVLGRFFIWYGKDSSFVKEVNFHSTARKEEVAVNSKLTRLETQLFLNMLNRDLSSHVNRATGKNLKYSFFKRVKFNQYE